MDVKEKQQVKVCRIFFSNIISSLVCLEDKPPAELVNKNNGPAQTIHGGDDMFSISYRILQRLVLCLLKLLNIKAPETQTH